MISTSTLRERIALGIAKGDFEALGHYLQSLRSSDHRKASAILAEGKTWSNLDEAAFWKAFVQLSTLSAKAYVGTLLKTLAWRAQHSPLTFESSDLQGFCALHATAIDRRKMQEALLPLAATPQALQQLSSLLGMAQESEATQASLYLKAETPLAYHQLFLLLRRFDDNLPLVRRFAIELLRQNTPLSLRMASIVGAYFDLGPLPGTFSLQLSPHQFSRLEGDFASFTSILFQ